MKQVYHRLVYTPVSVYLYIHLRHMRLKFRLLGSHQLACQEVAKLSSVLDLSTERLQTSKHPDVMNLLDDVMHGCMAFKIAAHPRKRNLLRMNVKYPTPNANGPAAPDKLFALVAIKSAVAAEAVHKGVMVSRAVLCCTQHL